jgi:hypothetical protein
MTSISRHTQWPWYRNQYCLKHDLACVKSEIVDDETMLVVNRNSDRVDRVLTALRNSQKFDVAGLKGM